MHGLTLARKLLMILFPEYCALRGGIVAYDACAAGGTTAHGSAAAQMPANCRLSASHAGLR